MKLGSAETARQSAACKTSWMEICLLVQVRIFKSKPSRPSAAFVRQNQHLACVEFWKGAKFSAGCILRKCIAAWQALEKLNPELAAEFRPNSGLDQADLTLAPLDVPSNSKFVRQRRHTRVRLRKPLTAVSTNLKENCRLEIKTASLAGGIATIDRHMHPGTPVQLRFQAGLRTMQATALLRDYRAQDMAFEFVDMPLDERSKFRRILADSLASASAEVEPAPVAPQAGGKR